VEVTVLPPTEVSREVLVGRSNRRVNLVQVARCQRMLLRLVLASLCVLLTLPIITIPMLRAFPGGPSSLAARVTVALPSLFFFVLAILSVVQALRLLVAAGGHPVIAYIVAIPMIVPIAGLIIAALINERATKLLRTHGVRVGFMGVKKSEMIKLTYGYCANCGYPWEGLTGDACPECGTPLPRAS